MLPLGTLTIFKVVVLTGSDTLASRMAIQQVASVHNVRIVGIVVDRDQDFDRRFSDLRSVRNILESALDQVSELLEAQARLIPQAEVTELLRKAFPDTAHSLSDFTRLYQIPISTVPNLNSREAANVVRELDADLGIVLGTRMLKSSIFTIPRLGCISLHRGKLPEYRGEPAGFWELYNSETKAAVSVYFVDSGWQTGDIVAEEAIEIHSSDTPSTLRRKLDIRGGEVLAEAVRSISENRCHRVPQPEWRHKPNSRPAPQEVRRLEQRLHLVPRRRVYESAKAIVYLTIYRAGLTALVRSLRKVFGIQRVAILLYHRVNNETIDPLTVCARRFAEHLLAIAKHYSVTETQAIVDWLAGRAAYPESSIAIQFDDCYQDVYSQGAPLLHALQFPACAFISTGFVGNGRKFEHDRLKCPFPIANLSPSDLQSLRKLGFQLGAHTVNHVNLGACDLGEARQEVHCSVRQLSGFTGEPVTLFAFPFGRKENIRPEVVEMIQEAGCEAVFSAYGGFVDKSCSLSNIPRIGVSGAFRALDVLMEIEGLSFGSLLARWRDRRGVYD